MEYCRRDLSYDSDGNKAFAGIVADLSTERVRDIWEIALQCLNVNHSSQI
jgi:hypothetical protein